MKKLIISFCITAFAINASAQDIHFSQFYNSPLTLNPALTGRVNGAYRVGVIYRNQWLQSTPSGSPFVTYSGSFDMPFHLKNKDAVGAGVVVYQDNAGDGALKTTTFMASGAYHKALDKAGKHSLSLGTQLGYLQKKFDDQDGITENQFVGTVLDPTRPNGESLGGSQGSFDLNVGLMWNSLVGKRSAVYAGGSIFHVLEPTNNFVENTNFDIPRRFSMNAGADIGLGEKFSLLPSVIYQLQESADELNIGLAAAYMFSPNFTAYLGGFFRNPEIAPIIYTAFEFKNFRLGISYDIPQDEVKTLKDPGSVELSLIYIGKPKELPNPNSLLFCPRF